MALKLTLSEKILVAAGAGILISVPLIAFGFGFSVWIVAKVLYGIGVILFLCNR